MGKKYEDVVYDSERDLKMDIYADEESENTVFYIHGGGLECGDKTFGPMLGELCSSGFSVISVDYRLYPRAKFPEFIEDCAKALSFTVENRKKYGYGGKIVIVGGSAGAYISLMLYFDERYLKKYGLSAKDFHGFLIDSAQPTTHFNVLRERNLPTCAVRVDDAAPIYFIENKNYGALLYIVTYENDMFCRKEQNEMLDKTLQSYGVGHKFFVLAGGHCSGEWPDEKGEIRLLSIIDEMIDDKTNLHGSKGRSMPRER